MRFLLIMAIGLVAFSTAVAQQAGPTPTPTPKTVEIPATAQVEFRNLQMELAQTTIRAQQLQLEIANIQAAQKDTIAAMSKWIEDQAKALKVDITKFILDDKAIKFIERPPADKPKQ